VLTKTSRSYTPRGFRAAEAATYLGMGLTKFLDLVDAGRLPRPKAIDKMRIWDRHALDAAFDDFAEQDDTGRPNSFDQILGGQ
jgi:hypothetical protein